MKNIRTLSLFFLTVITGHGIAAAVVTFDADLADLVKVGNHWVGVSIDGEVVRSTDGVTFSSVRVPEAGDRYRALAASGAVVVAVGTDGIISRSTDGGLTWADVSPQDSIQGDLLAVASNGNDRWVAVGEDAKKKPDAAADAAIYLSTNNGAIWTKLVAPADTILNDVVWDAPSSRWIAVGGNLFEASVYFSPDGQAWTAGTVPAGASDLLAIAVDPTGNVLGVGSNDAVVFGSAGGTSLEAVANTHMTELTAVAATGEGLWAIGGESRLVLAYERADNAFSTLQASVPGTAPVRGLVADGQDLLVVGDYSSSGGPAFPSGTLVVNSFTGETIEVSLQNGSPGEAYVIQYSSDLVTWTTIGGSGKTASTSGTASWALSLPEDVSPRFWRSAQQ